LSEVSEEVLKTTVIVSVYKDTEALGLILESLESQTYRDFDVIVSEDCDSEGMRNFFATRSFQLTITHLRQEDIGWRKNRALNHAVRSAQGEYLIFIDGDVIPYTTFVEMHVEQAQSNRYLSGTRVELGPKMSSKIRHRDITPKVIEKWYLLFLPWLIADKTKHLEEGIFLKPNSFLERKLNGRSTRSLLLLGCNFSCYKADLEKINGFDEDYISPTVGEDVDLAWRFAHFGITEKSVRHMANMLHLYHTRSREGIMEQNQTMMHAKMAAHAYVCKNGLQKL